MAVRVVIEGDSASVLSAFKSAGDAAGNFGQQIDHASEKTRGLGSIMGGGMFAAGMAGFNILKDSVGGLAGSMIGGAAEFQRYETQFGVLLKSSTLAKERLKDLADFGAKTPFELPEVVRADKILQGFGLHSEEAAAKFGFSGVQIRTIAGDLAAGTGSSFEEMATLIGKFSTGATGEAISRMAELGITSRDELAKMGLEFSKSGELLSPLPIAMETILKLTQDKFGGMMDKQSATLEGQMSNLQDSISGTLRGIGEAFLPQIQEVVGGLTSMIAGAQPMLIGFGQSLGDGVKSAAAAVQPFVPILQGLIDVFVKGKEPLGDWSLYFEEVSKAVGDGQLASAFVGIVDVISALMESIRQLTTGDIGGAFETFRTRTSDALGLLIPDLQVIGGQILAQVTAWGQSIIAFVAPIIPPLLAKLAELGGNILGWLAAQIPPIVAQLVKWASEFVAWVAPFIPPLFAALADVAGKLIQWLADQIPPIIEKLKLWAGEMVAWVAPFIPPLLAELAKVAQNLVTWLGAQIPVLMVQLLKWAGEFVAWVAPFIPPLLLELAKVLVAITGWIVGTAIPGIVTAVVGIANAFIGWVAKDLIPKVGPELDKFQAAIKSTITDVILPGIAPTVASIGTAIINGIGSGLDAGLQWLKDKAEEIVAAIVQAAKDKLGIHSPSSVFHEIGENIASGLAVGILAGSGTVQDALSAMIPGIAQLPLALQERNALDKNLKDFLAVNNQKITAENERHVGVMANIQAEWAVIDGNYQHWKEDDYQARYLENQRHDARMAEIVGEGEAQTAARALENQYHSDVMRDLDDIAKVKEYNYHNDSRNHSIAVANENTLHDTRMVNLAAVATAAQTNHDKNIENLDKEIEKLKAVRDAAIAARAAPGDYRGIAFGGALGGASGAGGLTLPWGAGIPGLAGSSAGIRALAQAFSPGAIGTGGRNIVQHQIDLAQDQLKELQKISAGLDQRDREALRTNEKNLSLLEKLDAGLLDIDDPEHLAAVILQRSLTGNTDDTLGAIAILKAQATQIKEDAIDRKIAESTQQLALNSQLDTLKTIKETNDAQLQYLMDIAANTSILAGGGGRFTPPGNVVPVGYGSGFATVPTISSDILIGTKHNAGITISIGGITVQANSIAAGQAAGRAAAYEIEAVLANAARQRNLGL